MSKQPYRNVFTGDEVKETMLLSMEEVGGRQRIHWAMHQNDNSSFVMGTWPEVSRLMGADGVEHAKQVLNQLVDKKIFCLTFACRLLNGNEIEVVTISDENLAEKLDLSRKRAISGSKGGKTSSKKKANDQAFAQAKTIANSDIDIDNDIGLKEGGVGEEKRGKKKTEPELVFPSEGYRGLWDRWTEYKKTEHSDRYKSRKTEQAAIDQLVKISGGDLTTAEKIVTISITNRYKGLFEIKNPSNGHHANFETGSSSTKGGQRISGQSQLLDRITAHHRAEQ